MKPSKTTKNNQCKILIDLFEWQFLFKFNSLELVLDITFEIYSKMSKLKLKVSGLVSMCEELTEQPF